MKTEQFVRTLEIIEESIWFRQHGGNELTRLRAEETLHAALDRLEAGGRLEWWRAIREADVATEHHVAHLGIASCGPVIAALQRRDALVPAEVIRAVFADRTRRERKLRAAEQAKNPQAAS